MEMRLVIAQRALNALILVLLLLFLPTASAEEKKVSPSLKVIEETLQEYQKFDNPEFHLSWAREAYRHGNVEGALNVWYHLAEQGNEIAQYVLMLFTPLEEAESQK